MTTDSIELYDRLPRRVHSLREMASVCFRHYRFIVCTFCIVFGTCILYICVVPRTYEAETEILVKRERADPIVTPDNTASPLLTSDVNEEDLNSEVEILQSRDLLEKVVLACGLDHEPPHSVVSSFMQAGIGSIMQRLGVSSGKDRKVALAVRRLNKKLKIDAI